MRIWFVNLYFGIGTAPTGALAESAAQELHRRGSHVEVLASRIGYNSASLQTKMRFQGHVHWLYLICRSTEGLFGRLGYWINFYLAAAFYVFTHRMPDRVIVMTTPPLLHLLFVVRRWFSRHRFEIILWNQDTYPEILAAVGLMSPKSPAYRFVLALECWSTRRLDRVLVLDGGMEQRLRNHGARDVRVVPNWEVHTDARASIPRHAILDEIQEAKRTHRFVVLYSGNYGWGHDLSLVLRYIEDNPDQRLFYFVFIGGGEKWKAIERLLPQHEANVTVASYAPRSIYDAIVRNVDFGLVALEESCIGLMSPSKIHSYLARGKPLIYLGQRGSNVAEAIEAYQCGFVIGERNQDEWIAFRARLSGAEFNYSEMEAAALNAFDSSYEENVALMRFAKMLTN